MSFAHDASSNADFRCQPPASEAKYNGVDSLILGVLQMPHARKAYIRVPGICNGLIGCGTILPRAQDAGTAILAEPDHRLPSPFQTILAQHAIVKLTGGPEPEADAAGKISDESWLAAPAPVVTGLAAGELLRFSLKDVSKAGEVDDVAEAMACDSEGDQRHRSALIQDLILDLAGEVEN
ncbi:hypothetical protein PspLS_07116 [Pyricularia sp. CBS 133598]|nr:hypothetical protein PspLS_07116 [Pyricularia sp. CBS 133598]